MSRSVTAIQHIRSWVRTILSPFLCAFSLADCAAAFCASCCACSSARFRRSSSCSCSFIFFSWALAASSCISRISVLISWRARSATVMSSTLGNSPWKDTAKKVTQSLTSWITLPTLTTFPTLTLKVYGRVSADKYTHTRLVGHKWWWERLLFLGKSYFCL